MNKPLPKPTIKELSLWQKEYYSIRNPKLTKEEYIRQQTSDWYRYWYYELNHKNQ